MSYNNDLSKEILWFLQITLSKAHKVKTTCLLEDNFSFLEIFNFLEKKFLAQKNIKKNFEIYMKNNFHSNKQILTRYEIESLRGVPLSMHAPLALEYRGNPTSLSKPLIGIVGSRHPTYYGRLQAQKFARELTKMGLGIISGCAIGVDAIANLNALESNNGSSVGVIGNGILKPYPSANSQIFSKLSHSNNGLLLSEFSSSVCAQKWHFPQRNVTIAELCDMLIVIEAKKTSGSLMTAKFALECGKLVGALPGNVDNPNTEGTHMLLKNGGLCIHTPEDVSQFLLGPGFR